MVTSLQGLNMRTADNSFFLVLEAFLQFSLRPAQALVLWKFKLKYKSKQTPNTLTEGLTRGLGVHLTCRSMHFHSSDYQNNNPL